MAGFQPPINIIEAIERIKNNEYLLPAFQREYVWSQEQIERLFDSLMRGYPISSMLFWKVRGENKTKWQFYRFLEKYRERYDTHNEKFDTSMHNDFYAILDGQQRLTSIYLALCGHYDTHRYRKKWENEDDNFHICDFYFNLTATQETKNSDIEYEFLWLDRNDTKEKVIYIDKFEQKWFKCKHILELKMFHNMKKFWESPDYNFTEQELEKLGEFYTLIFSTSNNTKINYYLEEDDKPEKAVNIFIRINSGGTSLDYSDILFSYAVANWQNKDARTEINDLVDYINNNLGFNISKDFILKAFLFLYHSQIKFQINSFENGFIRKIEEKWSNIKTSIIKTFVLLKNFGLDSKTLSSNNAVFPIVYYIYHKNLTENIIDAISLKNDREIIKKYILGAILLKPLGGSGDNVLTNIRKVFIKEFNNNSEEEFNNIKFFDEDIQEFPLENIEKTYKYVIDNEYLNELMNYRKDSAEAFAVLSLLFNFLDTKNHDFHKDHLHPISKYKDYENYTKSQNIDCLEYNIYDSLPNLQLLDSNENMSKRDRNLKEWVEELHKNDKSEFMKKYLIPDVDLELENFNEFYEARKELMIKKLKEILRVL